MQVPAGEGGRRHYLLASWMMAMEILIFLPRKMRMRMRTSSTTVPMIPGVGGGGGRGQW